MGRGVNLGNIYDYDSGNDASFEAQRARIDILQDAGFQHIRVPVTWGEYFVADSNKTFAVDQVVRYALQRGLYVVLNTHHEHWLKRHYDDSERYNSLFADLWRNIATRFKDEGPKLVFEVLNEPDGTMGGWGPDHSDPYDARSLELTRRINQVGYDTIRSVDHDHVILVMPNGMGQQQMSRHVYPDRQAFPDGGMDTHLGISVHTYDPWDFCGESGRNAWFNNDLETMRAHTRSAHREFLDWGAATGIPMHVGEYGVGRYDSNRQERDSDIVREYYRYLTSYFIEQGIPTTVWDDQGWFGILSREGEFVFRLGYHVLDRA